MKFDYVVGKWPWLLSYSGTTRPPGRARAIAGGKNPEWNTRGHERFGWTLSTFNPLAP